jgi:hypothetical protein
MAPLRTKLLAAVPGGEVTPARLGRISPRTLLTLVAAVYVLAGVLGRASLRSVLGEAAAAGRCHRPGQRPGG